jgi:uncharacterized protein YbjQ (UPF0145 family)
MKFRISGVDKAGKDLTVIVTASHEQMAIAKAKANGITPYATEQVTEDLLSKREAAQRAAEVAERAANVLVTTTPTIEGHRIVSYLGIESVEIVIGTGFFSELTGDISDFFGVRSKAFEGKLQEAKKAAFDLLKTRAEQKGANAVVGVDLDYTEFTGNRIGLIVNGTMVRAVRIAEPNP